MFDARKFENAITIKVKRFVHRNNSTQYTDCTAYK